MGSVPAPGTYSASQISTLIGLNPYSTPLAAFQNLKEISEPGWNQKHGYVLPDRPDNAAIRFGLAFEDSIIKLAEEKEGHAFSNMEELYTKQIEDITLSCHVDAKIEPSVYFEGKSTNQWAYTSTKKEIVEALKYDGGLMDGFQIVRRWGDPGTDEVPQEYQIQAAVQRICTGAELVKLSVLVFPRAQQDYEDMGWTIHRDWKQGDFIHKYDETGKSTECFDPDEWSICWAQQGNFHQYLLPSNPDLEKIIIEAVQRFHENNFIPGIPPDSQTFADVKRILPFPIGTVIATTELRELCQEYSEIVRQLGTGSRLKARQEVLKPLISDLANGLRRSDQTNPSDKFIVIDPDGGDTLATIGKNKNGAISFRAARAK